MKKEVFSVDQSISKAVFSDLSKNSSRFKLLFVSDDDKHKIIIIDSKEKTHKILNVDLDLDKSFQIEHISSIDFYDIDYDRTNEIIISTDLGKIIIISLEFDSENIIESCNSYRLNKYDIFSEFSKCLSSKNNSSDIFKNPKKSLSSRINGVAFPVIITHKLICIAMDKYLINLNMVDFCINSYFAVDSDIHALKLIHDKLVICSEQKTYLFESDYLLKPNFNIKSTYVIDENDTTNIISFYSDLLLIKENSIKRINHLNKSKWNFKVEGTITPDILAYDYDNDGYDDLLVVSKSGKVYALDKDGKIKWHYDTELWNTNQPLYFSNSKYMKKSALLVSTFDGKIYLFKSKGILNLIIEPSSAIMLDYGFYDVDYDADDYLTGNVIHKYELHDTVLENFKLNNDRLLIVSPKGNIYFIDIFQS